MYQNFTSLILLLWYYKYSISPTGVSNRAPWCLSNLFSNNNQPSYFPPLNCFDTGTKYGHVLFDYLSYFSKTFSSDLTVYVNMSSIQLSIYIKYLYFHNPRDTLSDIPRRYISWLSWPLVSVCSFPETTRMCLNWLWLLLNMIKCTRLQIWSRLCLCQYNLLNLNS